VLARELGFRHFQLRGPIMQPAMLQIAGGTDRLAHAFARKLGPRILLDAPVRELRQDAGGVRVVYGAKGKQHEARADFAVCALPLSILRDLQTDFPPELREAIASVKYEAAGKIGLQFNRRFWEEDDRIFGGNSFTDQTIMQIMYPSTGMLERKGVPSRSSPASPRPRSPTRRPPPQSRPASRCWSPAPARCRSPRWCARAS
jgi:monoamine oxidase